MMNQHISLRRLAIRFTFPLATTLCFLLAAPNVRAQTTRTWVGSTNGAWLTVTNWSPNTNFAGGAPLNNPAGEGANNDIALFTTTNAASAIGINFNNLGPANGAVGLILGGIDFNKTNTTAATIGNSSTTAVSGAGILQLNGVTINSIANTLVRVAGSANLTLAPTAASGTQAMGVRLGTTNGIFDVDNGRTLTISSIISEAAANSGFTKTGAGTLSLGGNNNYTGAINVNNGTLTIANNNALGTTASGTTITGAAGLGTAGTTLNLGSTGLTLSENININGNALGRARIYNNSTAAHVLDGAIDVTSATSFAQIWSDNSSGSVTINGDITGTLTNTQLLIRGNSTNANNRILGNVNISGDLSKTDGGTWLIGAAGKTYSWGNTGVATGTLRMGADNVLPSTTVVTLGQNANTPTLDLNGFSQTVAGIQHVNTWDGSAVLTITSGAAATLTVGDANNYAYGGVITGSVALSKTGSGTLTLTGANTYTGATSVTDGILQIGNDDTTGTLGNNSNTSIATGAELRIDRSTASFGYSYSGVLSGSGLVSVPSNRRFNFQTNNQTASGNLAFTVDGVLGINTLSGVTAVHLGELSGGGSVARAGNSGGAANIVIGGKNTNSTFSGTIGSPELSVEKVGTGILTLSGPNTYGGTTTVTAGTLLINGSTSASSAVTVNGGTLGGTGDIGGAVTVNAGIFSPGASIESLATGTLVLTGGGTTFEYEIDRSVALAVGGDLSAITGDLNISFGTVLTIDDLGLSGTWSIGDKLTLISYSGTWNNGLFTYDGNQLNNLDTFLLSGVQWQFRYDDTAAGSNFVGDLTWDGVPPGGGFVTMTVVPEPSSLAMLALGMITLWLFRKKKV